MEGNDTFVDHITNQSDEHDMKKNIIDSLVQEELKFSLPHSSSHQRTKQVKISSVSELEAPIKSKEELLQDIILSLAMEQRAVAQLIQAEAKHIQAFLHHEQDSKQANSIYVEFQSDLVRFVEGLVDKQKMSMRLLDLSRVLLKEE